MQLYSGTSLQFIEDTVQNQIADKLKTSFFNHYRYNPSPAEVRSWHNSLIRIKDVFQRANLNDHGVILEYQLPLSSKRLDCMITGKDPDNKDNAVIVELKQWDSCEESDSENEVVTWVGNGKRTVLHPSIQVKQYQLYLQDTHTAFYEEPGPISAHSCSYLHNYSISESDPLLSRKFQKTLKEFPLFSADQVDGVCSFLDGFLRKGDGLPILQRIQDSKYRASKKLLDHVGNIIKNQPQYVLLDEQLVVYDEVFTAAKKGFHDKSKTVLIVHGGPGTGKSVIAINLMADLSLKGFNAHYATGSKAFTETLRKITGTRAAVQFKYFNSYGAAASNEVDVMILDESHRIRKTSASRFTPRNKRSGIPQIEELLSVGKVCAFFIDDRQVVRPDEVGSSTLIKETAERLGHLVKEYQLEAQFRCSGSDAFVNWVDNSLGVQRTANVLWEASDRFEFKIFDSPHELEGAIRKKSAEGSSARLTAGFCWPWSQPTPEGTLLDDVVIGDFKRPWDARPDAGRLAPGIPKASLWAYDPNGINQVGCVYTAQGFEFDYVGIIFGKDLYYNPKAAQWEGRKEYSADSKVKGAKEGFVDYVKNTYRVLLTRGLKGCYVYFMDEDTKNFFQSRIEGKVATLESVLEPASPSIFELKLLQEVEEKEKFIEYLPVLTLAAAASGFSAEQDIQPLGWAEAKIPHRLSKDMFIARVKGKSMEPLIPDGSYCVFRWEPGGSRNGKVVLVESRQLVDSETSGKYTVKRYQSEKELFPDGTWRHKQIVLSPENNEFKEIVLENIDADMFRVIAEFVCCLESK